MFGALFTVAIIATSGSYGAVFDEEAFRQAYRISVENPVSAEFANADISAKVYKQRWTDTPRKGMVFYTNPLAWPAAPRHRTRHPGCDHQLGIHLTQDGNASCRVISFRWVLDVQNSVQVAYFALTFGYGAQGDPFALIIPVFAEPSDASNDENWMCQTQVRFLDITLERQLYSMLNYDWDSMTFKFEWLNQLLLFKVFYHDSHFTIDGEQPTSFVTRPVLVQTATMDKFIEKFGNS